MVSRFTVHDLRVFLLLEMSGADDVFLMAQRLTGEFSNRLMKICVWKDKCHNVVSNCMHTQYKGLTRRKASIGRLEV